MDPAPTADVLLISADLFLGSRIRAVVEAAGHRLDVASSMAMVCTRLEQHPYRLVLIDLETPLLNLADVLSRRHLSPSAAFIAYGPHVRTAQLDAARQIGCDEVLTRGQLDASLDGITRRYLDRSRPQC